MQRSDKKGKFPSMYYGDEIKKAKMFKSYLTHLSL